MNILSTLRDRFAGVLADFTDTPAPFAEMVKPAQDARFGDYQSNCVMPLAKQLGSVPRELAARIVDRIDLTDLCVPLEIAGPGFINMKLRDDWLENQINVVAGDPRLGVEPVAAPQTIVVDFSSPNVAKPMHVGHLRSTVIGDSIARTLSFLGHRVITDNHVGDWGTQFGMIIYGFKHLLIPSQYEANPVGELARLYRLVHQLSEYHNAVATIPRLQQEIEELSATLDREQSALDPSDKVALKAAKKKRTELEAQREELRSLQKKVETVNSDATLAELAAKHPQIARLSREETAKLHAGDLENVRLWEEFVPECLAALQRLYDRLHIQFDLALGESYYNPWLADVVRDLEQKKFATTSDGAVCVFISGNEAPFIVRKADGAFTYATTDLATIQYRVQELQADRIIYVVDDRQSEHFKLLFATARLWGYDKLVLQHVSFGTVMGPDHRPYKTRSGDTVGLESLIDDAVAKAKDIILANNASSAEGEGNSRTVLSPEAVDQVAETVGVGGIKYADLHHNRESDYVFDAEKMLAMTGNTATYMQYAYARVQGIFRKAAQLPGFVAAPEARILLQAPTERALALKLCRYGETLESVAAECRPHLLTQYLFELANDLTAFYGQCPVLQAEETTIRDSRLRLCDLAGRVIQHGLSLLGIQTPAQM
ncbi:arginine--tRNA ligase [Planctomicrobium sp. SH664]|uniref:arginine--tRNA ligase n=1 Tax=Planctomicrobium sp. SH664 TaxID=3448125 RepID=UPI003F5B611D